MEILFGLFDNPLFDFVGLLFDSLMKGLLAVSRFGVLGVPIRNADRSADGWCTTNNNNQGKTITIKDKQ